MLNLKSNVKNLAFNLKRANETKQVGMIKCGVNIWKIYFEINMLCGYFLLMKVFINIFNRYKY